jgi:hypothetical protein
VKNVLSGRRAITVVAALGVWAAVIGWLDSRRSRSPAAESAPATLPSTPPAALATISRAIDEGDATALSKWVTGDAGERAWILAYAAQLRAFRDLDQALAKRYLKDYAEEDSGKEIHDQIEGARDQEFSADLKRAKLGKVDGNTVLVIFDESAADDLQGRLVRVDGRWKMELSSLSNYFSVDDTPVLRAMADAAAGLARDVSVGKFSSIEEAAKAVEERLTAAQGDAEKKPQPAPAGRPKS